MKITTAQPQFIYFLLLFEILITPFLFLQVGAQLTWLYVLPTTAALIFTLWIRSPFQIQKSSGSRWCYFRKIIGLECGYLLMFFAVMQFAPSVNNTPIIFPLLQSMLIKHLLFPWPLIALLACGMVWVSQHRKQACYGDTLATGLLTLHPTSKWWSALNLGPRYVVTAFTASTLAFAVLMLLKLFGPLLPHLPHGLQLLSIITAALVISVVPLLKRRPLIQALYRRKHSVFSIFVMALLIISALIALLATLAYGLPTTTFSIPALTQFQTRSNGWLALLLAYAWWFGASWLLALQIAYHSRERGAREIISACLLLPAVLAFVVFRFPDGFTLHTPAWLLILIQPLLLISGLSMIILGWKRWSRKEYLPMLLLYHLPIQFPPKKRDPLFFMRQNCQIGLLMIAFYLVFQSLFLTFFFVTTTLFLTLISPLYIFNLWIRLIAVKAVIRHC